MTMPEASKLMNIWRFGLIGCGSIADFHIQAIKEIPNAKLSIVSSRNADKAATVAAEQGCDWTADYMELLKRTDVDIIIVATSSGSHAEIGLAALQAGKHVIVEKPMAMNTSDASKLIEVANTNRVTLSVISQRRFEPQHLLIKQLLDDEALGKLLLIEAAVPFYRSQDYYDSADWRGTLDQDGGALMNQGIHSIDLFLWLGGPVSSVYGRVATQTHRMEAEDIGLAVVRFQNGTLGTIMSSTSIVPGFPASLNLYGERGSIKLSGTTFVHWTVPGYDKPDLEAASAKSGVTDPRNIDYRFHQAQLAQLIDAIEQGKTPMVTGEDGRRSVQLIEAIYHSSRSGYALNLQESDDNNL